MPARLLVAGSSNTDLVISAASFPAPGQTIMGTGFFTTPGGKGANQAVAAARLGGRVTFVARVGQDAFGRATHDQLAAEGIDGRFVTTDPDRPSGMALITLDAAGENTIVVAPGANDTLGPEHLAGPAERLTDYDYLLTQLETPLATVVHLAELARRHNHPLVLNPAPAVELPPEVLDGLYLITPNETEAELLTGQRVATAEDAARAADLLHERGVGHVVITLGARGAYLSAGGHRQLIPTERVTVRDTTAAGDTFTGALVVALGEGQDWPAAVVFANRAAARSVTRLGAQASIPRRTEL